jgi:DMSO/TMAO reductase YedYZ molybdopterin-dependent catalytic subunit
MSQAPHPILNPVEKSAIDGDYLDHEVGLAHRNHGLLLEALRHDVTPAGMHYLLTHFDVPYVPEPEAWTLVISGLVERPTVLSLPEIKELPQVTLQVTLECAGNGRSLSKPRWPSQPWHMEAVGTAAWTGTPLANVLRAAGLKSSAREVVFLGADRGFDGGIEHDYGRSLQVPLALGDDVLLVTAMNGQPLLPQHGSPLRLIVPGWYGMASVKWLNRVEVIDHAFQGFQQVGTYIFKQHKDAPGTPVTTIRVKSLMVPPGLPDWYTRQRLVEHGVDGRFRDATLDPPSGKYAWRGWHFLWDAAAGEYELCCRATDANGDCQPLDARFDRAGFGNNTVHRVPVTVR